MRYLLYFKLNSGHLMNYNINSIIWIKRDNTLQIKMKIFV